MLKRIKLTYLDRFAYFTCLCGNHQAVNEAMPWCGLCVVEYDIEINEDTDFVILRPKRKTERYALAKALNKSGGMKIGTVKGSA